MNNWIKFYEIQRKNKNEKLCLNKCIFSFSGIVLEKFWGSMSKQFINTYTDIKAGCFDCKQVGEMCEKFMTVLIAGERAVITRGIGCL